ncbi:prominin-1-A [Monomorium pharaonis]|uniref:prominin-1-A n=1 Tax=Monomorium pharaonis TaxID=307658 RepID=UPI00063F4220|nr:prominin-1-A [Monomorium pharaonis]XP_036142413.1 prominin-1-A [Monomorium pharaonis]XP_036142421.1 prominin-1-A [Monomorium pharaonis]
MKANRCQCRLSHGRKRRKTVMLEWKMIVIQVFLLLVATSRAYTLQESVSTDSTPSSNNCSTTDGFLILRSPNEAQEGEMDTMAANVLADDTKNNSDVSPRPRTLTLPRDWDEKPNLKFPKFTAEERYKMTSLHLDKGWFAFEFLRGFLSFVQPYDVPTDLLADAVENRISTTKLISESLHVEAAFLGLVGVCCVLACIIPGMELWLACRPIREDYKPPRHPGVLTFLLTVLVLILGSCMVTMIICNEAVAVGIEKLPLTVETALQDLKDYHADTTSQLRKCLTRSLDVASEAILADLDNVEELLGKPVQAELSAETGLDVALDALVDLGNATQELSARTESLLREGERARELGLELSRETDEIRRDLEGAVRACSGPDRSLCAVIDSSGIRLDLRIERLLRDDRLLRLQSTSRENLTEAGRQARGEYLHVPDHIARTTLDARNQIRREINAARARIVDQTRTIETNSFELSEQLDSARSFANYVVPYVISFERIRWIIGMASALCILPILSLLIGALCCRCGSENKVRPTLLCNVVTSCFVSITLWAAFIVALGIASHTEMLICRPLSDPDYHTMEVVLETQMFLGRKLTVSLKKLFEKCRNNEAAYSAFGLENVMNLDHLTAHWAWPGLSRAISNVKVDLKGLQILTPNLRQRLQDLLYVCGLNLTAYRIMVQEPIMSKDISTLSDQLDNISRQLRDQSIARELQSIGTTMRDLTLRRVKPLMKLQNDLVYGLAVIELQVQPLWRQVNQSISHLRTIQYYIDHQGEKIAQLKAKLYMNRLSNYLDQWRTHVFSEMSTEVSKCRPLWNVLEGLRYLLCAHILSPLDGFWFATFVSVIVMIISTPTAHILSLVYKKPSQFIEDATPLSTRTGSLSTDDDRTWQMPEPPPPPQSDW